MTAVSVVGLGAMGSRIAARLIDVGHEVVVWNRTAAKAAPLVDRGATLVATPADAARRTDVVLTMLADPVALEAVATGGSGIATGTREEATVIEMSTVGPQAVAWLRTILPARAELIDAPVLGSLAEAESGSLTILAGGPPVAVDRWRPLLSSLGVLLHVGPLGSGAAAKLVANAAVFGSIALLGEAVSLSRGVGLSYESTFNVLARTPLAAQVERRRTAIENDEYQPRFPLRLARKDAELIANAACHSGVDARLIAASHEWIRDAARAGLADRDYTAILAYIIDEGHLLIRRPCDALGSA